MESFAPEEVGEKTQAIFRHLLVSEREHTVQLG